MEARILPILALALLLTPAALAQSSMPPRSSVWNVLTTVDMDVRDNYATVRVIADITNRGPDPEFPFRVTIPDDAFVTGLTIERDGQVYEATIASREQARQEYDHWKQQGQTGGLVEKTRHATTYAYLINVAEWTNVRATLTYERYLAADRGVYNLSVEAPVSGFGRDLGAKFSARVASSDGVGAAWSTPAASAVKQADGSYALAWSVGPRPGDAPTPFELDYTLAPTGDGGMLTTATWNGTSYFVHRFRAPAGDAHMPVDLVMVLDVSGSMSGLKFQQLQDAAKQVISQLGSDDRLHLAFFSNDANAPWDGLRAMTPDARKDAAREVDDALVAGGTNLGDAIRHGFAAMSGAGRVCDASASSDACGVDWAGAEEGRLPVLLVLTDGEATVGVTDRLQLRQIARDANTHHVNVFAIAFGSDADWNFIHGLAADGDGVALRVPEGAGAEVDLGRFMTTIATPVLKNVRIVYNDDAVSYRASAPVLFAGSELVVVGTYDASKGPLRATVTARAPDGQRTYDITATDGGSSLGARLPRLVAYEEIRRDQDLIDAEGERADWVKDETALALAHGFVTDYTSLVVTVPQGYHTDPCQGCDVMVTSAGSAAPGTMSYDSARTTGSAVPTTATSMPRAASTNAASSTGADPGTGSTPTPTAAKVPAPAAALVIVALAAVAVLALPRRR